MRAKQPTWQGRITATAVPRMQDSVLYLRCADEDELYARLESDGLRPLLVDIPDDFGCVVRLPVRQFLRFGHVVDQLSRLGIDLTPAPWPEPTFRRAPHTDQA